VVDQAHPLSRMSLPDPSQNQISGWYKGRQEFD
jgi:hypothetical protein